MVPRAKYKWTTETIAPVDCIFCEKKERHLLIMSKKQKQSQKLYAEWEYQASFQRRNAQHVESSTEQWGKLLFYSE